MNHRFFASAVLALFLCLAAVAVSAGEQAFAQSPDNTTTPTPTTTTPTDEKSHVAAFYYPWYRGSDNEWRHWDDGDHTPPNTWGSNYLPDIQPGKFNPKVELYDSKNQTIVNRHIDQMKSIGVDTVISSWFGQDSSGDQALELIMKNPNHQKINWTVLYEDEGFGNPSLTQLVSDLDYIKTKYTTDPNYLKINGKPVIFVYNAAHSGSNAMEDLNRWKQAKAQVPFHVVFKVDPLSAGANPSDMEGWYQYAPAAAYFEQQGSYSAFVSPGFWHYDNPVRLPWDSVKFEEGVKQLKNADVDWKLIQTWNEWGEGTSIEPGTLINHDHNGFTQKQDHGSTLMDIFKKHFNPTSTAPLPPASTNNNTSPGLIN